MRQTVDSSFAELDKNLNLDPQVREQAQEIHNDVRDTLKDDGCIKGSFLQGSFVRKTMLKPLKDVDIVCLLPDAKREHLLGPDGPALAMESFKAPLRRVWPEVEFDQGDEPSGKALRLSFSDLDFTVDLVPTFEHTGELVLIGDRHEGTWTPSNTRIQLRRVRELNQQMGGRFVHQVRELKALIKNDPDLDFISGIVVESLAYACLTREVPDKEAIATALSHAASAVLGPVMEPAGDDDVTVKWTDVERSTAARSISRSADVASEALALERDDDVAGAIDLWHSLFGDVFPKAPDRSVEPALKAWLAGSVSSTGRPTTTRSARQQAAPGRPWSSS